MSAASFALQLCSRLRRVGTNAVLKVSTRGLFERMASGRGSSLRRPEALMPRPGATYSILGIPMNPMHSSPSQSAAVFELGVRFRA
jgi:hypothetical protein